jgi:hypothetical protein
MTFERGELDVPLGLQLVQPGPDCHDRFRSQPEDPRTRVFLEALVAQHASSQEDTQVLAHGRRREPYLVGKLACAPWAGAQQLDHLQAARLGQGVEEHHDTRHILRSILDHIDNIYPIGQLLSTHSG